MVYSTSTVNVHIDYPLLNGSQVQYLWYADDSQRSVLLRKDSNLEYQIANSKVMVMIDGRGSKPQTSLLLYIAFLASNCFPPPLHGFLL